MLQAVFKIVLSSLNLSGCLPFAQFICKCANTASFVPGSGYSSLRCKMWRSVVENLSKKGGAFEFLGAKFDQKGQNTECNVEKSLLKSRFPEFGTRRAECGSVGECWRRREGHKQGLEKVPLSVEEKDLNRSPLFYAALCLITERITLLTIARSLDPVIDNARQPLGIHAIAMCVFNSCQPFYPSTLFELRTRKTPIRLLGLVQTLERLVGSSYHPRNLEAHVRRFCNLPTQCVDSCLNL